jgi:uncharacterized protein
METSPTFLEIVEVLRQHLPQLRAQYHVDTLQTFGSYVRAEQTAASDLDLLVTFTETPSLLEFIALENYLSDLLGVKVDLVMASALKPALEKLSWMRPYRYDHKSWLPTLFRLVIPNVAEQSEESFNPIWLICSARRKDSSACGFGMTMGR